MFNDDDVHNNNNNNIIASGDILEKHLRELVSNLKYTVFIIDKPTRDITYTDKLEWCNKNLNKKDYISPLDVYTIVDKLQYLMRIVVAFELNLYPNIIKNLWRFKTKEQAVMFALIFDGSCNN